MLVGRKIARPALPPDQIVYLEDAVFANDLELGPVGQIATGIDNGPAPVSKPQNRLDFDNGTEGVALGVCCPDLGGELPTKGPSHGGDGVVAAISQHSHGHSRRIRANVASFLKVLVDETATAPGKARRYASNFAQGLCSVPKEKVFHDLGSVGVIPHGSVHPLKIFGGRQIEDGFQFVHGPSVRFFRVYVLSAFEGLGEIFVLNLRGKRNVKGVDVGNVHGSICICCCCCIRGSICCCIRIRIRIASGIGQRKDLVVGHGPAHWTIHSVFILVGISISVTVRLTLTLTLTVFVNKGLGSFFAPRRNAR
mmetsp:Transcript_12230/g.25782  ORF Transcript_12230/g.25782 Transcript_12230/m.25782 type:complete len:309 (+) Transcript_12230:634-1560(+)